MKPSQPRTHVLMFDRQFVPLIESGDKCQTYRTPRKRRIVPGDWLSLRYWEGAAYRSQQREIMEVECTSVEQVRLTEGRITYPMAVADGFGNVREMEAYFDLPWEGILIRWRQP